MSLVAHRLRHVEFRKFDVVFLQAAHLKKSKQIFHIPNKYALFKIRHVQIDELLRTLWNELCIANKKELTNVMTPATKLRKLNALEPPRIPFMFWQVLFFLLCLTCITGKSFLFTKECNSDSLETTV